MREIQDELPVGTQFTTVVAGLVRQGQFRLVCVVKPSLGCVQPGQCASDKDVSLPAELLHKRQEHLF